MVDVKRSSIVILVLFILACLYVTLHPIHISSFIKKTQSTKVVPFRPTGVTRHTPNMHSFINQTLSTKVVPFTVEEIQRLENGFEDQEHPRLLQWLRTHWILPPSAGPLNLAQPQRKHFSQYEQSAQTDEILQQKRNGFFVECGAWDGEVFSNSLFFERERNWTGLLIESLKVPFQGLKTKNRNVFSINACLNIKNESGKAKFGIRDMTSGLKDEKFETLTYKDFETVQCFTLYSLMKALNRTKIDLFSLDVEGAELSILKTIPFPLLDIDLLLLEYAVHMGSENQHQKRFKEIDTFLKPKGYEMIKKTYQDVWYRKKNNN